jgi:methyltransferase-like protein/trans-aconitate methyltransferase
MSQTTSYNEVIYPESSFPQAHPDRLATLGLLLGMTPRPIDHCRVLELGCGTGGQVIPLALTLPGSTFVGIDAAEKQIAIGQQTITDLGLSNIELHARDFMQIEGGALGQFDYIIAHGIYSWIPPAVQERLLALFKSHLAPHGIGYISYNTMPGWHLLQPTRRLMLYRTRGIQDPRERSQAARAMLRALAEVSLVPGGTSPWARFMDAYHTLLDAQNEYISKKDDEVFLHDEMEDNNDAIYFYEFIERIARHGMQYLSEAHFPHCSPNNLPGPVRERIAEVAESQIDIEQYIDFYRCRTFRQTLVVHDDVEIERRMKPGRVLAMYASTHVQKAEPEAGASPNAVRFVSEDGLEFTTSDAVIIAQFERMRSTYPRQHQVMQLLQEARDQVYAFRVPATTLEQDQATAAQNLLYAYSRSLDMLDLHSYPSPFVSQISEAPRAFELARYQAAQGSAMVTNVKLERVVLNPTTQFIIRHLDGETGYSQLLALLRTHTVLPAGSSASEAEARLGTTLDETLQFLLRTALLVG